MALLFIDGYDHYSQYDYEKLRNNNAFNTGAPIADSSTNPSRTGARALAMSGSQNYEGWWNYGSAMPGDVCYMQYHFCPMKRSTAAVTYEYLGIFADTSGNYQSTLVLIPNRHLAIYRGGYISGTLVDINTDYRFQENVYHFIQIKWTVSNSLSPNDIIVKVDGQEILNPSSGDSAQQATTNLQYVGKGGSNNTTSNSDMMDNWIVMDNQGGVNDGFTSTPTFIQTLWPNGAGNYTQWTPLGGTNYNNVDDTTVDDDTSYVEADEPGYRDSYAFDNTSGLTSATILGVQVCAATRSTSITYRDLKLFTRIGGVDYDQTGYIDVNTQSWDKWGCVYIWDESPDTGTAWTYSEIDGAEFGIEMEA